ncbi:hypothetical protein FY036_19215 [Mesorhizobium microcysteis]|uniref:Uncharacterized protein n=1 Tax=Neoaquamicrobium microcysteis TaxID=2682781 RepID=A0A5D4GQN9_9HYPH|nr:hypothetical protein [Mesorhizobium microcysteis]TYR30029.1 hypothetical protein FY036_19215 [Mesorhizobium microcysteis]
MIQSTLFFILGFLSAGFLALLVAPAIWRRAVTLTRRRVEASVPLTMDEIQAGKDSVRAELAMTIRKLEMNLKAAKEKVAAQMLEMNALRDEQKRALTERDVKSQSYQQLEARAAKLEEELAHREEDFQAVSERLVEHERKLEARDAELKKLGRMYDEASLDASSRQIEAVAHESRLDKLKADISILRNERKEADQKAREVTADNKAAREALKAEHKKVAGLERRVEQLTASLADAEDRLERRERELGRLRDKPDQGGGKAARRDEAGEAMLREQIHQLAAEVVNLTAKLDGPDSPIGKALAEKTPNGASGGTTSLADRIRALQQAAGKQ